MYEAKKDGRVRWLVLALIGLAFFLGLSLRDTRDVHADSRRSNAETTTPLHLKSGAARSEAILLEIANSLKRIESRLERFEKVAQRTNLAGTSDGADTSER